MRGVSFEQCEADACVMRLVEAGPVSIVVVVHVDDIFAMGLENRCAKFYEDLNQLVPVKQPGGVTVVRKSPIFSRLGCRDVDDITAGFR